MSSRDTIYLRGSHQQTTNATLSLFLTSLDKSLIQTIVTDQIMSEIGILGIQNDLKKKPSFRNPNLHHDASLPNSNCLKSGHIFTKVGSTQLTIINMQTQMTSFSDSLFLTLQKSVFQFHFLIHRFLLNS